MSSTSIHDTMHFFYLGKPHSSFFSYKPLPNFEEISYYIIYSKLINSSSKLPSLIKSQTVLEYLRVTGNLE